MDIGTFYLRILVYTYYPQFYNLRRPKHFHVQLNYFLFWGWNPMCHYVSMDLYAERRIRQRANRIVNIAIFTGSKAHLKCPALHSLFGYALRFTWLPIYYTYIESWALQCPCFFDVHTSASCVNMKKMVICIKSDW